MAEDILEKFRKFASRSRDAYNDLYDRIKEDRRFMNGGTSQWDKDDDRFIEKTRNRITVNVISNQCQSVANKYSTFPFTWSASNPDIDREIDDFFTEDANRFATEEALLDVVSVGLGVLALGTDTTADGREVPVVYSVTDTERVMLDDTSTELDGSDMMECALIDYRSKEWIRVHMGEEYVPEKRAKPVFTGAFGKPNLYPIITYYVLDTDGCHVYTFVNDIQVTDEFGNATDTVLPFKRIPVFPVWGEKFWNDDDEQTYRGLISKSKSVQKIVNYCMTALCERMALSPKPQFRGYMESFKGYDSYYKRAGSGVNPILPAQRLANDNKTQLPLPEVFLPNIKFDDLQGIMAGTMDMMTSITGVDSKGLAEAEGDITATAVMYTSQVFQNNIKHFFSHLRTSFKALGDCVMVLLGHPGQKIDVVQGPEAYMQNQVARQELVALMGVVEPNQKRAIVNAILRTHPDNEILAQLYAELNAMPQPTAMEAEMQEVIMQMKAAIEQKNEEIMNLTAQLDEFRRGEKSQATANQFELLKAQQSHEFKLEEMAVQAELNQGADAVKMAADADKAQMDIESKGMDLEMQRMRMDAEATKAMAQQAQAQNQLMASLFGGNENEAKS